MSVPALASLSLTHVNYTAGDPVSYVCAWLALVPQALCVMYVTLLWSTREAEIALMFAGQMACEALNFVLKRLIKEERPTEMLGKGYGFPSSHAQFLAFFAVYLSLFALARHRPQPRGRAEPALPLPEPFAQAVVLAAGAGLGAAAVGASRIYLNYHTPRQVVAGQLLGGLCGGAWFFVTEALRRSGALAWALDTWLAQALRVRDLVVAEDLPESGWRAWQSRRGASAKKGGKKTR